LAKYGVNYYGASKYGAFAKTAYSVEPMSVLVLDFNKTFITWQSPRGAFSQIRLLRSQAGFPETSEDGIIIFEEVATEGTVSRSYFIDGEDNPLDVPLIPGRQVYYRMFLFTDQNVWRVAGSVTSIIPSNHQIQNTFMNSLPRVFTSSEQGSFGVVDASSALYNFIYGLTFSTEQMYTLLDLLRPRHTGIETPVELLPVEVANLGLTPEPGLPTKNQKRLIREALYMYSHKGTKLGLETYLESLTGYAPTITVSKNILLTVQDSTFYRGIGNWVASNAVLTSSTEQIPDTDNNQIDTVNTGKVVASNSGSMVLGATNVITKGVPVLPSTEYTVSCKLKSPASAGNITLSFRFYDKDGTATSAAKTATVVAANNTWKSASKTATSDVNSSYAIVTIAYSAAGTYYIDQVCMQEGNTVVYDEARALDLFLNPIKTNYIKNPSFEVNSSTWSLSGSTFLRDTSIPTYGYSGTYSGKFVVTNPWSITTDYKIPVVSGKYYTLSASIKALSALSLNINIKFYNIDDELVKTSTSTVPVTTGFAVYTLTALTDSQSDVTYAKVSFSGTTAGTIYLDLLQFEQSQKVSDYFDGSLPSDFGVVWEGTENASYSRLYPSKPQKVPRVAKTIKDWIPQNALWRVRTYAGVEYTTLTV
jgi:phage tail-like protein